MIPNPSLVQQKLHPLGRRSAKVYAYTMDQLQPPGANMPFPAPRRHSTVPTSFQPAPSRNVPTKTTGGSVETLFSHPSVKIIAFSAGKSAFDRLGSSQEKLGSLQPSSQFERTIAIGTFFALPWSLERRLKRTFLTLPHRRFPNLSSPRFCCLPPFRIGPAANPTQEPMLVLG